MSHSTESYRRGTILCFRNFRLSKKFVPKWGTSRFSTEKFLSHTAEIVCRGTILTVNSFGYRKNFCLRGLCRDILAKFFSFIVPENIVGEAFFVPQSFWYRKCMDKRRGVPKISVEIFLSHVAEKFRRGTILGCVSKSFR